MFGTPEGMRVVRIEDPLRVPQIGLLISGQEPVSLLAQAMLTLSRGLDVRGELDRLLHKNLDSSRL